MTNRPRALFLGALGVLLAAALASLLLRGVGERSETPGGEARGRPEAPSGRPVDEPGPPLYPAARKEAPELEAAGEPDEGKAALLARAREAFEAARSGDVEAFKKVIERLLAEPEEVLALLEYLAETNPSEEEQEWVLSVVQLSIQVYSQAKPSETPGDFDAREFFRRVLALVPALPEKCGNFLLGHFARLQLLDPGYLNELEACLAVDAFRKEAAKALIELASRAGGPHLHRIERFLEDPDPALRNLALGKLVAGEPEVYLPIAKGLFRKEREKSPQEAALVSSEIARNAPPEEAFAAIREMAREKDDHYLLPAYEDLKERGLGDLAAERYFSEEDPKIRGYLLWVARDRKDLVEYAVEFDEDSGVRTGALVRLVALAPNEATGKKVLAALADSKADPWNVFTAAENLAAKNPSFKGTPTGKSLYTLLLAVASDSKAAPGIRNRAEKTAKLYAP